MIKSMTIFYHERDQSGMVIMNMNNIRAVLPASYPIANGNLEGSKPFHIIIIAINFFPVEQPIDINKKQIKTQLIVFFFYDAVMKPFRAQPLASLMYEVPFIIEQKPCPVHRNNHFGKMAQLILIFRQGSYHITETTCFCDRVTFC